MTWMWHDDDDMMTTPWWWHEHDIMLMTWYEPPNRQQPRQSVISFFSGCTKCCEYQWICSSVANTSWNAGFSWCTEVLLRTRTRQNREFLQVFFQRNTTKNPRLSGFCVFVEVYEVLQIPMNSMPSCEYTMKPKSFVMFSCLTPHSRMTKPRVVACFPCSNDA